MFPERFALLLRRRLRLPVWLCSRQCEACGAQLDDFGDHYAACMHTGRVQARAKPLELTWVRVLREAGATVHAQKLLREVTAFAVPPSDARRVDALATALPFYQGRALFCDATIRSPLTRTSAPHTGCAAVDGASFQKARKDKERKYPEVVDSPHAELLTLAVDVGGRWNDTALELVSLLAKHKVAETPLVLRRSAQLAWTIRWWTCWLCPFRMPWWHRSLPRRARDWSWTRLRVMPLPWRFLDHHREQEL